MNRILLLPVTLPLRVAALQLRVARSAAEIALDVIRGVADRAPWAGAGEEPMTATAPPVPEPSATPLEPDRVEPARAARRRAAASRTPARPSAQTGSAETAETAAPGRPRRAAPRARASAEQGSAEAASTPAPAAPRARASTRSRPAAAANGADPAAPAAGARRRTARSTRPAATPPTPPADTEPPPKPRARRTARKATAAKPARQRKSGPTRGEAAAIREAQRETEGQPAAASVGPDEGPGPQVRVEAPWEGYDAMPLDQVLARLADADETLLAAVRLYESTHENRQAVLLATESP